MKKKITAIFLLSLLSFPAFSQMWTSLRLDSDYAKISFLSDTLNLGSVKYKGNGYREIKYFNTGKCPLVVWAISGMPMNQAVLGKKFLFPGDSGVIRIYYPTNVPGTFSKTLSVFSNALKEKQIIVKGTIEHEEICAGMSFEKDEIDLGPVPYVIGKHFIIKVPSTGKCPLNFTVAPGDDYLNVLNYNEQTVDPGQSGIIEIHIGGQVTGNYYGTLDIYSSNAKTKSKSVWLKAEFMPPAEPDSARTTMAAIQDLIDVGTIAKEQHLIITYTIKNTGKKLLVLKPADVGEDAVKLPARPVAPGKTESITVSYNMNNVVGAFLKHIILSGNFKGTTMPLYVKGYMKPN